MAAKLLVNIEDLLREGTENPDWDARLQRAYDQVMEFRERCPAFDQMSPERQQFLMLMALLGADFEEADNISLH